MTEPAVIQHEHLYAQPGGLLCDRDYLLGVEVEVGSLPVVDKYGSALVLILAADKVLTVEVMEGARHFAYALIGVYHYYLGGGESFARFKEPFKIKGIYAHDETCLFVLCDFCLSEEVARINEVETEDLSHILVCIMCAQCNEWVVLVGGFAAAGIYALLAVVEGCAFNMALPCP